eukprot:3069927-Amphidinium_carterae.1
MGQDYHPTLPRTSTGRLADLHCRRRWDGLLKLLAAAPNQSKLWLKAPGRGVYQRKHTSVAATDVVRSWGGLQKFVNTQTVNAGTPRLSLLRESCNLRRWQA